MLQSIPVEKTPSEEHKKIRDRLAEPYTLTGIDRLRALYEWQGLEFDECIFDDIIKKFPFEDNKTIGD